MEIAEHHLADRALVGQPFLAVAGGEPEPFGGAVVLVDDGPPPVDHLLLHLAPDTGLRRGPRSRGRQIEAFAFLCGKLQHAAEHGGHELGVGDRYCSMSRRYSTGSNRSMIITVPPLRT